MTYVPTVAARPGAKGDPDRPPRWWKPGVIGDIEERGNLLFFIPSRRHPALRDRDEVYCSRRRGRHRPSDRAVLPGSSSRKTRVEAAEEGRTSGAHRSVSCQTRGPEEGGLIDARSRTLRSSISLIVSGMPSRASLPLCRNDLSGDSAGGDG